MCEWQFSAWLAATHLAARSLPCQPHAVSLACVCSVSACERGGRRDTSAAVWRPALRAAEVICQRGNLLQRMGAHTAASMLQHCTRHRQALTGPAVQASSTGASCTSRSRRPCAHRFRAQHLDAEAHTQQVECKQLRGGGQVPVRPRQPAAASRGRRGRDAAAVAAGGVPAPGAQRKAATCACAKHCLSKVGACGVRYRWRH